jgi:tetratricopeptide (TPR) repeat protein/DNA-binding CsgD family transcriptional regulator
MAAKTHIHVLVALCRSLPVVVAVVMAAGCSQVEEKKNTVAYDALATVVAQTLKTNADSSLTLSAELYRVASGTGDKAKVYGAAKLRGKAFQIARINDSALAWYQKMRAMAFEMGDTSKMLETCNILGTLFVDMGSNDSVGFWYGKGLLMAKSAGDSAYRAGFSANMGLFHSQNGQEDSAMICFSEAARYYEKHSDSANMAQVYRNIGNLFLGQRLYAQAKEYYSRSAVINATTGNILESGTDFTNMAVAFMMMGSDSAQYYYRKAMRLFTENGAVNNLLPVKFNYANYLKGQGHFAEAEQAYREVLQISRTYKILQGEMYSLNQLGRIEAIRKNTLAANEYFEEAIRLAEQNRLTTDLIQFYHEAFEGNMDARNVETALRYFKIWEHLNDSLKTNSQRETILKYQTMYESQVLQSKVHDLNNELKLKKSQNIITLLIALVLLLFITTIAIVHIFRNRQARQRQLLAEQRQLHAEQENHLHRMELEKMTLEKKIQDEQLTQMNLEIQLREQDLIYQTLLRTDLSNLNRSVQEKLLPFHMLFTRKKDQQEYLQAIQEIARDAAHEPLADFEMMFKQMHGNFFEKLLAKCPDFTKSELQVASMMRLNLSTKEIARLINLSPATIETTRHHIRKKLELDQKESLTACLISI